MYNLNFNYGTIYVMHNNSMFSFGSEKEEQSNDWLKVTSPTNQ